MKRNLLLEYSEKLAIDIAKLCAQNHFDNNTVFQIKKSSSSVFANITEAAFSVSADKQVIFSAGNLQHHPKNNEWRFAENQYDYLSGANANLAADYDGWVDMFRWSTDNPATPWGVSSSTTKSDYLGTFVDWGNNMFHFT